MFKAKLYQLRGKESMKKNVRNNCLIDIKRKTRYKADTDKVMKVMKFGGTSVRDAGRIRNACSIISNANEAGGVAVVSSAMKGVTDSLIAAAKEAEEGNPDYTKRFTEIESLHNKTVEVLLGKGEQADSVDQQRTDAGGDQGQTAQLKQRTAHRGRRNC